LGCWIESAAGVAKEEFVQGLFLGVAALACPVGMGLMMSLMMRGGQNKRGGEQQVAQLRAEIDELKADRVTRATTEP
jgi:hypothetical protein